jgi:hypothetical protein
MYVGFEIFFDLILVSLLHLCFLSYISILQAIDQAMVAFGEDSQNWLKCM